MAWTSFPKHSKVIPRKGTSADAGYCSYENLEYARQKGREVYMPDDRFKPLDKKEQAEKRYHKGNFGATK